VATIDANAFGGCSRLAAVNIPQSVTNLSIAPFLVCTNLTAITVDVNNPAYSSLGGVLFDKGQTIIICYPAGKIGSYTVPDGVSDIGYMAFSYSSLTTIFIPNSPLKKSFS